MCDPMCYPLLLHYGDGGVHALIPYTTTSRKKRDDATAIAKMVDEDEESRLTPCEIDNPFVC